MNDLDVTHFGWKSGFVRWDSVAFTLVATGVLSAPLNGFNQNGSHPIDLMHYRLSFVFC